MKPKEIGVCLYKIAKQLTEHVLKEEKAGVIDVVRVEVIAMSVSFIPMNNSMPKTDNNCHKYVVHLDARVADHSGKTRPVTRIIAIPLSDAGIADDCGMTFEDLVISRFTGEDR
jgi:hypothetical protein